MVKFHFKIPKIKNPHININKKAVLKVLAVVVIAVALLTLAGGVYHHYREQKAALSAQHQKELQAAFQSGYTEGTKDSTTLKTKLALNQVECKKGQNAFTLLPTTQKRLIKADQVPNCNQPALLP